MAGVKDRWEADIWVDGKPIGFTKDLVVSALVRSSIHSTLPSVDIQFNDIGGRVLKQFSPSDDQPLQIALGDGRGSTQRFNMKTQGGPKDLVTASGVSQYRIVGVLDNLNWMRKVHDKPIKGNSVDVLRQLAQQVGLDFEGDSASDLMTWLPNQTTLSQYARFVTERAYAGGTSCFVMGVSDAGKLLFKDLDKVVAGGSKATFGYGEGEIPYFGPGADSKSAAYNNQTGYGASTLFETLDGVVQELNKVNLTKMSNFLNVGSSALKAIGDLGGRVNFLPLGGGNTHTKYEQAQHQNTRIKAMWANDVSLGTDVLSGLSILDKVNFNPRDGMGEDGMAMYKGAYVATAKVMGIINGRYVEKFVLTNTGTNQSNGGGLL